MEYIHGINRMSEQEVLALDNSDEAELIEPEEGAARRPGPTGFVGSIPTEQLRERPDAPTPDQRPAVETLWAGQDTN